MRLCDDGHDELVYDEDARGRRDCPACELKDRLAESGRQLRDADRRVETLEARVVELEDALAEARG